MQGSCVVTLGAPKCPLEMETWSKKKERAYCAAPTLLLKLLFPLSLFHEEEELTKKLWMVRKCVLPNCIIKIDRYYKMANPRKEPEKEKYAMHVLLSPVSPISKTPLLVPLKATSNAQDNIIFQKTDVCQSSYDLFFITLHSVGFDLEKEWWLLVTKLNL